MPLDFFKKLFRTREKNSDPIAIDKHDLTNHQIIKESDDSISTSLQEIKMTDEVKTYLIDLFAIAELKFKEIYFKEKDPLFDDAARLIVQSQIGSPSLINRKMKLDYNRAEFLMLQLEDAGIVGPFMGFKAREVLIKNEEELEKYLSKGVQHSKKMLFFYDQYKDDIEKRKAQFLKKWQEEKIGMEKEQIRQDLLERERKRQLQKEVLKELIKEGKIFNQFIDKEGKREIIPQDIMDKVWNRDGGKCVICGSQENLEFDHIIPFSKGGATTYRNLQVLCKKCNIEKSNRIG